MATINVYEQYFEAKGTFNGRKRHGVLAALVSDSSAGQIRYYISVSFFPHDSADDFAVSYDACFEKTLFEGKGRRSKKKEQAFLDSFRDEADALAKAEKAEIFWDKPLREERRG